MDLWIPLILAVVMGATLDVTGALHVYGMETTIELPDALRGAWILLAIALLWLLPIPGGVARTARRAPPWLGIFAVVAAILSISDVMRFIASGWTPLRIVVLGGGTLLLLIFALARAPGICYAIVALVAGILLRVVHMRHVAIDPVNGDMLPLVQDALANLFRGQSPYTLYKMPWDLPLTYLPLTWLAYAPTIKLGIDLRWTNIIAELAILGAAIWAARRVTAQRLRAGAYKGRVTGRGRMASTIPWYRETAVDTSFLLWACLFLSPTIIHWDVTTTAPIGWAAIAWTLALTATSSPLLAALSLGLAAATTPLIAVCSPLIIACWWRRDGLTAALQRILLAGGVALVILAPWFIWAPGPFLDGNFRWFNDLNRFPRIKWNQDHTWSRITGFAGYFWQNGQERWLKPIQAALVLAVTALYIVRGAQPAELTRYCAAAFLLFILFNPVLWPYLYNPALVAAFLAVATSGIHRQTPQDVVASRQQMVATGRWRA